MKSNRLMPPAWENTINSYRLIFTNQPSKMLEDSVIDERGHINGSALQAIGRMA
jgi:hypothetical protein